ncbi:MAG: MmgE/PrpD family protein [Betaproteobacteria bacterium]|nr:MmgE/PrpD family protein [Betaproteobacteria bacterium]
MSSVIALDSAATDAAACVTARLAECTSKLRREDIPDAAWDHAKLCLLDTLGCGLFGSRQPWGRIAAATACDLSPGARASLWGGEERCGVDAAAMANGTAAHGFELDDVHLRASMHPGAVTVPAAFALAEAYDKSPSALLTAVIAGYEVGLRIGIAIGLGHGLRGHHTTGTVGTLAAAATAANLLGLDAEATADALGIAATQAAGLHGARTGAMSKRFHAGRAAQSGVIAATLAARGFTGSRTALEQSFGGFFSTLCDRVDIPAATAELGKHWEIQEVGFKCYASCASTHTTIDAIERLMQQGVNAGNLKMLRVYMSRKAVSNVGWPYVPAGVVAAQMNGYYTSAVKLLDGEVFVEQFAESRLADPRILALIERIRISHDPVFDAGGASTRHAVRVEAELDDASVRVEQVDQRRGSSRYPLGRADIERKFLGLAGPVLSRATAEQIVELIGRIDELQDMDALSASLHGRKNDEVLLRG